MKDTNMASQQMSYRTRRRPKWLDILGLSHRKEQLAKWRWQGLAGLCLAGIILTVYSSNSQINTVGSSYFNPGHGASRHLLATSNDSSDDSHLPEWERCDWEKANSPYAWLVNHIVCILVIFIALAIICDDFFVPSLEVISEKLNLSEDVAGATFMAAGSSAPELFTSVAGVAVETDVGVGTIVGSAVFNLLIIIALTAALAGQILHLDWRPLMRDAFFYAMSIACFIGFAWDGYFQHYEAVILLVLYILYIVLMVFNPSLMDWMETWRCCCSSTSVSPSDDKDAEKSGEQTESSLNHSNPKLNDGQANGSVKERRNSMSKKPNHDAPIQEEDPEKGGNDGESNKDEESDEETMQLCPCLPCCPAVRAQVPSAETAKEKGGCWNWFMVVFRWVLFIPAFPFICIFSWTIPDCSKEHNKKYFILSFLASVLWIAILSFGMVTLVGRTGCIIGIDGYVMGLVVVAVGTSIPDALSSVLVARDGFGDMAVSNAIGSNVFDINLGLGLPFIIRIAIDKGEPIGLLDADEWVDYYEGTMPIIQHAKFGFILLLILAIALIIFGIVRFRLNKWVGICFVIMYVLFLAYAFIQELYCVRQLELYC